MNIKGTNAFTHGKRISTQTHRLSLSSLSHTLSYLWHLAIKNTACLLAHLHWLLLCFHIIWKLAVHDALGHFLLLRVDLEEGVR